MRADPHAVLHGSPGSVLVVDDHRQARESMADVLRQSGHRVACCSSAAEALEAVGRERFDCIVTDLKMPGMNGVDLIIQLERRKYEAQVVMVTAHASVDTAVEAMRHGAFDYIEKPFDVERLERLVARAIERGRLLDAPAAPVDAADAAGAAPAMIGSSRPMRELRRRIAQVAATSETVLITGESGTGKELVARSVHAQSERRNGPLVSLNCPVLSAHLMESELFGHERGAFTGAETSRTGRFELAAGGSILLDEVTEIDLNLQAKLLRVLQERSFERVGSSRTIRADARVIATTNRNLDEEVAAERFRADLYYRLAVLPLVVPPLRDRAEDVPELVDFFLAQAAARLGREACELTPGVYDLLAGYGWPGNVRELENLITRTSVLAMDRRVDADQFRRWLAVDPAVSSAAQTETSDGAIGVGMSLEQTERKLIEATLERFDGHRAKTAQALGIGVRTLSGKLRQYGYAPRAKSFRRAG
ncbi:MAG: sigma-54-dependent Fis family transcriptional regulator [Pirellulales bacterium]|nr:sigma-54-dependent Fis family transcriptional regulator [Pirellulales bacterium]